MTIQFRGGRNLTKYGSLDQGGKDVTIEMLDGKMSEFLGKFNEDFQRISSETNKSPVYKKLQSKDKDNKVINKPVSIVETPRVLGSVPGPDLATTDRLPEPAQQLPSSFHEAIKSHTAQLERDWAAKRDVQKDPIVQGAPAESEAVAPAAPVVVKREPPPVRRDTKAFAVQALKAQTPPPRQSVSTGPVLPPLPESAWARGTGVRAGGPPYPKEPKPLPAVPTDSQDPFGARVKFKKPPTPPTPPISPHRP